MYTGQPEISDQQTDYEGYEYDDYEDEILTTICKQVFNVLGLFAMQERLDTVWLSLKLTSKVFYSNFV